MDELPPDAKEFLARAHGVHDPTDPAARARVERRLAAALALGSAQSVASHPHLAGGGKLAGGTWLGGSKIMLASALLMLAGGSVWLAARVDAPRAAEYQDAAAPSAEAGRVGAPVAPAGAQELHGEPQVEALPAGEAPGRSDAEPGAGSAARRPGSRPGASAQPVELISSLAEEAALLSRVSERLTQRDTGAAQALLAEHRRRFPASQLREERDGFRVLAQCLGDDGRARVEAADFVAKNAKSVLVPRITSACGL